MVDVPTYKFLLPIKILQMDLVSKPFSSMEIVKQPAVLMLV